MLARARDAALRGDVGGRPVRRHQGERLGEQGCGRAGRHDTGPRGQGAAGRGGDGIAGDESGPGRGERQPDPPALAPHGPRLAALEAHLAARPVDPVQGHLWRRPGRPGLRPAEGQGEVSGLLGRDAQARAARQDVAGRLGGDRHRAGCTIERDRLDAAALAEVEGEHRVRSRGRAPPGRGVAVDRGHRPSRQVRGTLAARRLGAPGKTPRRGHDVLGLLAGPHSHGRRHPGLRQPADVPHEVLRVLAGHRVGRAPGIAGDEHRAVALGKGQTRGGPRTTLELDLADADGGLRGGRIVPGAPQLEGHAVTLAAVERDAPGLRALTLDAVAAADLDRLEVGDVAAPRLVDEHTRRARTLRQPQRHPLDRLAVAAEPRRAGVAIEHRRRPRAGAAPVAREGSSGTRGGRHAGDPVVEPRRPPHGLPARREVSGPDDLWSWILRRQGRPVTAARRATGVERLPAKGVGAHLGAVSSRGGHRVGVEQTGGDQREPRLGCARDLHEAGGGHEGRRSGRRVEAPDAHLLRAVTLGPDPGESRRGREGGCHPLRVDGPDVGGQAPADDDPRDAQPLQPGGELRLAVSAGSHLVEVVEDPRGARVAQRGRGPRQHRRLGEGGERLVGRAAPGEVGAAGPRQHEGRAPVACREVVDLGRRPVPGLRHAGGGPGIAGPAHPERRQGPQEREHGRYDDDLADDRTGSALDAGGPVGEQADAQCDGEPHEQIGLVDVAEGSERPVEPVLDGGSERPGGGPGAADRHRHDTEEHEEQGPARQVGSRVGRGPACGGLVASPDQTREPETGERRRRDDRPDRLGQQPPALPRRVVARGEDVGDPVVGPPQDIGHRGHGRGRRGELDVVEEGVGVPAEHEERSQPPRGTGDCAEQPPPEGPPPTATGRGEDDPCGRGDERDEGDRRVDPTEAGGEHPRGDGHPPTGGGDGTRGHPLRRGQEQPRGHRLRPDLDGDLRQHGEHAGREGEGSADDHGGDRRQPGETCGHALGTDEGDDEQEHPPQALHGPVGQTGGLPGEEDRPHREEVSIGLVLQLADAGVVVPRPQGPPEVAPRRQHQVGLGVRLDQARGDEPREHGDEQGRDDPLQPLPSLLDAAARGVPLRVGRHRRRSSSRRFHVTTSRRPGTRRTTRAASGR